ncbi:MAG: hypothetical protein H6727_05760 [Myxococcales bacterium]|nr:hypothetical protein [Myxococcales bacterium]
MPADTAAFWETRLTALAQKMLSLQGDSTTCAAYLRQECPLLAQHLSAFQTQKSALSLWGKSRNFDEFALQEIVAPRFLEMIQDLTGHSMGEKVAHAGLLHTYGYLFSLIETPFGFKRDRWIKSRFGERFGLPKDTFSPLPQEGSLLLNLTYFLGSLLFIDHASSQKILRSLRPFLSNDLANYAFQDLRQWRMIESFHPKGPPTQKARKTHLITHFVLPPDVGEGPEQLLIYGVQEPPEPPRLLTTFFVSPSTVEMLLSQPQQGQVEIISRYNASLRTDATEPFVGTRRIRPLF